MRNEKMVLQPGAQRPRRWAAICDWLNEFFKLRFADSALGRLLRDLLEQLNQHLALGRRVVHLPGLAGLARLGLGLVGADLPLGLSEEGEEGREEDEDGDEEVREEDEDVDQVGRGLLGAAEGVRRGRDDRLSDGQRRDLMRVSCA